MNLPSPQPLQDWLTQLWNIQLGRKCTPEDETWLISPISETTEIGSNLITQIATRENLQIDETSVQVGLVNSFEKFTHLPYPIHPLIQDFYQRTSEYDMDVWTQWSRGFSVFGQWVKILFAKRIMQLNLPSNPLDTAHGMNSKIIKLKDASGAVKYTVWLRHIKKTNEVIYLGLYSIIQLPNGEPCVRVSFPLPHGSATVILRLKTTAQGNLELLSKGDDYGQPGFYFLVRDSQGQYWKHFLKSFTERIYVYVDKEGELRTDHSMSLWGLTAFRLHYRLQPKPTA
jgi:hypothetical protein